MPLQSRNRGPYDTVGGRDHETLALATAGERLPDRRPIMRVLIVLSLACSSIACSSSPPPDAQPAATLEPAETSASAPASAPPAATASAPPAPGAAPPPPPRARCKALLDTDSTTRGTAIVKPPPPPKNERHKAIVTTLKSKREAFRCCYELWSKKNPRDATITVGFTLDEKGGASDVKVKVGPSGSLSPDDETCLVEVARAIRYPEGPGEKAAPFEYDFGFKHREGPPIEGIDR